MSSTIGGLDPIPQDVCVIVVVNEERSGVASWHNPIHHFIVVVHQLHKIVVEFSAVLDALKQEEEG